ncbi:MAG TPA: leucyl aminopeptidase [Gemmatimonadaceae bacterium]|nr:leucyl aminopeptidase [Gemmatimonadaceae bacterium]
MPASVSLGSGNVAEFSGSLLAIALGEDQKLSGGLIDLDRSLNGSIQRSIEMRDFRGGRDEVFALSGPSGGARRIVLIGMGKVIDRAGSFRRAAAIASRQAMKLGSADLGFYSGELDPRETEAITVGLIVGSWEYKDLKTPAPEAERRAPLEKATIVSASTDAARAGVSAGEAIGAGHSLARTLAMMPGNLCTPEFLANTATDIATRHGMKITVLGRKEMQAEGMGALLCVAQGTPQDPKLIAVEYNGGKAGDKPVTLVGKGLCFDSGGISIKPAQGMEDMKFDMCGAAGVLGALEAIGRMKLPINVVGLIGSTTNMPSGTAVNPGDVVKSHLGKYIEIINTDAEGRLVLADVLSYARRFNPAVVVDAATLTGAIVIALGHTATGVFSVDDNLVTEIVAAGKRAGEPSWPMPLWDEYKDLIKSDIADIKNSGGRPGGSISAAMFLKEFTEEYPWIHLDIAGTAYSDSDLGTMPKGPTGNPTGTFIEFVRGRLS